VHGGEKRAQVMTLDTINNSKAISSLYDDPEILEKGFLHALHLSPNSPTVTLYVRIASVPQRSPVKWGTPNNTILELQLVDVTSLHVSAWTPNQSTAVNIKREENGLISVVSADGSLGIICGWIYVARVHPYGGTRDAMNRSK
jgi:Immunity protein 50